MEMVSTKRGRQIGKSSGEKFVWIACPDCGKERWVALKDNRPKSKRCKACSLHYHTRERSAGWKGGRFGHSGGYTKIKVFEGDFFYAMADQSGYVMEHCLIMARHLGRCLHRWEIVHHRNHIRDDNRIENLQLVADDGHSQITVLERRIAFLEKRVTLLEAENIALRVGVE